MAWAIVITKNANKQLHTYVCSDMHTLGGFPLHHSKNEILHHSYNIMLCWNTNNMQRISYCLDSFNHYGQCKMARWKLYVKYKTLMVENLGTFANLAVHNYSVKVFSTNNFILADLLCKVANLPMCLHVLGRNPPKVCVTYNGIQCFTIHFLMDRH